MAVRIARRAASKEADLHDHRTPNDWSNGRLPMRGPQVPAVPAGGFEQRVASDVRFLDLGKLWLAARRQVKVLAICAIIGLLIGAWYLYLAPRSYVASAQILIDSSLQNIVSDSNATPSGFADETDILNQMEVMRSNRLADSVVDAEKLTTDLEFLNPPASFLERMIGLVKNPLSLFQPPKDPTKNPAFRSLPADIVSGLLRRNIIIERVGRSFVITLGYRSPSPQLAYRIATAYANAFTQDQLTANLDATRETANWLQQRLVELGDSQRQATQAVIDYRRKSGLSLAQDADVSSQRLEALTNQLVLAQAATAQIKAEAAQLQQIVDHGPANVLDSMAILTGPGVDETQISKLRTQEEVIQRRIAEVTATYGANHPQVAALNGELASVAGQVFVQMQALLAYDQHEVGVAQRREADLRTNVNDDAKATADSNQSQVQLNELQQRSDALKALYDSYLQHYEELVQRQSFPVSTARIITSPEVPRTASGPNIVFTLIEALVGGLFFGVIFAFLNENRERSFRVGEQVGEELGLKFIGYLPLLSKRMRGRAMRERGPNTVLHTVIKRQIAERRNNAPATAFVETLRAAKLSIDSIPGASASCRVIGVVSALPGEGKTTFAVGFAEMLAAGGGRVLLLDADIRHPGATELVAPEATSGILDLAAGASWKDVAVHVEGSNLTVLPGVVRSGALQTQDFISSSSLRSVLDELRKLFDYVVIDLPPVGPVIDALAVMPWTDGFILVTDWGKTPRRLIRSLLDNEPMLADHIAGVVLNKVDFGALPRFSEPGGAERFIDSYRRYYQTELH
jgi:succinoglycan biosynthesis transport protein ExoP